MGTTLEQQLELDDLNGAASAAVSTAASALQDDDDTVYPTLPNGRPSSPQLSGEGKTHRSLPTSFHDGNGSSGGGHDRHFSVTNQSSRTKTDAFMQYFLGGSATPLNNAIRQPAGAGSSAHAAAAAAAAVSGGGGGSAGGVRTSLSDVGGGARRDEGPDGPLLPTRDGRAAAFDMKSLERHLEAVRYPRVLCGACVEKKVQMLKYECVVVGLGTG
jgi:hypothetical protein